jgi:hypothetical protein
MSRSNNVPLSNGLQANMLTEVNVNEEDQLNRINLQALQNRDPYISKIIDQAQRVCVYKFVAEKRQWVGNDSVTFLSMLNYRDESYLYSFLGT